MAKLKTIALTTTNEILTMQKIMEIQNDIVGDTVTDDIFVTDGTVTSSSQLKTMRELVENRIDIIVVITYVLATTQRLTCDGGFLHLSEKDYGILHNEIDCYLGMITDMVGEDIDGTTLEGRVQHIVDVNMMLLKFK